MDGDAPSADRDEDKNDPPIRADLVARVRREIEAGTYETPEKWEQALERLRRRLLGD